MSLPEHSLPSLFPLVSYNYSLLGWDVHQKRWGGALASADIADKGVKVMVETGLWRSTAARGAQAEPCPPPPGSPSTSCLAASGHHGSGSRNRETPSFPARLLQAGSLHWGEVTLCLPCLPPSHSICWERLGLCLP